MAKSRRGRDEGGLYFNATRDCWEARVSLGVVDGKRVRRIARARTKGRTGPGKREAMDALARLQAKAMAGPPGTAEKQTVGEFLVHWLDAVDCQEVSAPTYLIHRNEIEKRLQPHLGDIPLAKLAPEHIQRMHQQLKDAGKPSARTRQIAHGVLAKALDYALERKWIAGPNPARVARRPRAPKPEIEYLTPEQCKAFREAIRGDHLEALYLLAVTSGLREGEILGLKWGDLDLDRGSLTLRRAVKWYSKAKLAEAPGGLDGDGPELVRTKLRCGPTKTTASAGKVPLAKMTVEALRAHYTATVSRAARKAKRAKLDPPAPPGPDDWVFPGRGGHPFRRESLMRHHYEPVLRGAGLPVVTFHALRHSFATTLLDQGEDLKVVQEMLRHTSIKTTGDTYAHVLERMGRRAVDRLEAYLGAGAASGAADATADLPSAACRGAENVEADVEADSPKTPENKRTKQDTSEQAESGSSSEFWRYL